MVFRPGQLGHEQGALMPRLPTDIGGRRTPRPQRGVVSVRAGVLPEAAMQSAQLQQRAVQRFGDSLQNVSNRLYEREQQAKELGRRQALADARIGAFREIADLQTTFDVDADPATAGERWRKASDAIAQKYVKGFGGDAALASAFTEDFQPKQLSAELDLRAKGVETINKRGVASLDSNQDVLLGMLSTNTDPLVEQQIVDEFHILTNDAVQNGFIDEVEAGKRRRDFAARGMEAKARGVIIADPEKALVDLANPANYPGLDEVKRTQLVDMATRRVDSLRSDRIRIAEKAERDAEKALKTESEEIEKGLWSRQADGLLTRDEVEVARARLDTAGYKALLASLDPTAETTKDDPDTVADFETRIDTQDIRNELTEAVKAKRISTATFRSLMDKNRSLLKPEEEGGPPSPYKSGRELVKTTLDAGAAIDPFIAAPIRAGQAQALVEYDNWAAKNPNATRAEAQDFARDVIARYQAMDLSKIEMSLGLPLGYSGSRSDLSADALDSLEADALTKLDSNAWTREQVNQELAKIASWRAILEQRAKIKAVQP